MESDSVFTLNAVGIPCVNDEISEVEVEEIGKHLRLNKNVLYRGSGKLDVLMGIDHALCILEKSNKLVILSPVVHN